MKKILLFTSDHELEVDQNLTALGQLGVVHITPFQAARDESIDRVEARIYQIKKAIAILENQGDGQGAAATVETKDYSSMERGEIILMETILDADHKRIQLEELKEEQFGALEWYKNWGRVSARDIEELADAGLSVKLYLLEKRELKSVSWREDIHLIGSMDDMSQVLLLNDDKNEALDYEEITLPEYPWEGLEFALVRTGEQLDDVRNMLYSLQAQVSVLKQALEERLQRLDKRKIQFGGLTIDQMVRCWQGFMPEKEVDAFMGLAHENSWGYIIEDPSEEEADRVPTLLHSPRWAERIRPVMNFMGLVSGYKEIDVSKVFLLFFTFFTGILVGDAGYGLVFMLLTFLVHRKQKFAKKIEYELFYTLSFSILIWGVLTGTYFGSEAIAEIPFFSRLRSNRLASFGGDAVLVQKFMFFIGAVHLSIARLQLAWKHSNSIKVIAQVGWIAIIWGLYLIVNQMVLNIPAPGIMIWLFIAGSVLIALFSNPGKNFFKGMLGSLGNLPLSIISGFSDIISYIRLYAVGLSTVLMATSFNQMALGDGITTLASGIGAVFVLILGHGLNMILAAMAVLVHGVRLNMLEYAGHADVEFSGTAYNPFKLNYSKPNKF